MAHRQRHTNLVAKVAIETRLSLTARRVQYGDGRGITLPGSIRLHVDADELADWVEQLYEPVAPSMFRSAKPIRLTNTSCSHERTRLEAHVVAQTALQIQVSRDREAARARAEKDQSDSNQDCGHRPPADRRTVQTKSDMYLWLAPSETFGRHCVHLNDKRIKRHFPQALSTHYSRIVF